MWEQPLCGSSPGGVMCKSTAAKVRTNWAWLGITQRSGKGTIAEFCCPASQHSSHQKWSLLTPWRPLQHQLIPVQMAHGKGAVPPCQGDRNGTLVTQCQLPVQHGLPSGMEPGAPGVVGSGGAAPSHRAGRARSTASWKCGCRHLTSTGTWAVVPSLQRFL